MSEIVRHSVHASISKQQNHNTTAQTLVHAGYMGTAFSPLRFGGTGAAGACGPHMGAKDSRCADHAYRCQRHESLWHKSDASPLCRPSTYWRTSGLVYAFYGSHDPGIRPCQGASRSQEENLLKAAYQRACTLSYSQRKRFFSFKMVSQLR